MSLDYFYESINKILEQCVPKKIQCYSRSKYVYPEWYTADVIRLIQQKATLHKVYKKSRSGLDYEVFSQFRAKVKQSIREAYTHHQHIVQSNLQENPISFWRYINSKKSNRSPRKMYKNGELLTNEQSVHELANYFYSVYSPCKAKLDVNSAIQVAGSENAAARVHLSALQLSEVQHALKQLKPKKSTGPDGIPPYIFRDCRSVLAKPLLHIYNQSLRAAVFPERWKTTRVVPVPKAGAKGNLDGNRPIAVLSTPAKIFESAIQKSVYHQMGIQLSDSQHGFRPNRSTSSNLLAYMADVLPTVDAGGQVDAVYFDFKKAFDLVDNDILLRKLAGIGFTPHLLNFFASYMTDRQQYVEYAGYRSDTYFTRSGVSQGSNLGPLEFIIMINDLPKMVQEAKCLLFADDFKLYLPIVCKEDCTRLQSDIDRVTRWSKENNLQLNTSKCVTITFSRSHNPIVHNYMIEDCVPMTRVKEVRDLGVGMNTGLTFREHIIKCCKKAYKSLGFILRTVNNFTNIYAITALYNTLVRSQLEYNAMIWSPHENKYTLMLERVQNKFLRYLYMRLYGVYPLYPVMYPTLFILGMVGYNEIRVRREFTLARYLYTVLIGRVHNTDVLDQLALRVPDRYVYRRRRPQLLAVPRARTNLLQHAPLTRALRTLNRVQDKIDIFCCTLSEFTKVTLYVISYS